ncbi:hypothetical protein C1H46_026073 [Malus baccata]|uniref:Uncharacterized protein n=1 Tax=Malus baccata TaxID=106549 RepID=A0A540LPT1_MALBA|nr:hypothetical protein C1H46_026073 [Malus baccata]
MNSQKCFSNEADQSTPTHPCRQSPLISMTKRPFSSLTTATFIIITATILFAIIPPPAHAFGSGSTFAVISTFGFEILAGWKMSRRWWQGLRHPIVCYRRRQTVAIEPNISFSAIFSGRTSARTWLYTEMGRREELLTLNCGERRIDIGGFYDGWFQNFSAVAWCGKLNAIACASETCASIPSSNANAPFWIPIHIVIPERPTECAVFNVNADSPRDSVQFIEWSPTSCPRALLIANFHGRVTIWTQPSQVS